MAVARHPEELFGWKLYRKNRTIEIYRSGRVPGAQTHKKTSKKKIVTNAARYRFLRISVGTPGMGISEQASADPEP